MDFSLKDHEHVVLGSVLANPKRNSKWLHKLIAKDYQFCDEYKEIAKYLLEKSFSLQEGELISNYDLAKRFNFELEEIRFWKIQGKQDVEPSYNFLVGNKFVEDQRKIFKKYSVKDNLTIEDFTSLQAELSSAKTLREFKTHDQIDENIAKYLDSLREGKSKIYKTPFKAWNDALYGIHPEDLIVLGAYSGMGKTHIAIQISLGLLDQGGRVMFVSGENSEEEIKTRFGSHLAKLFERSIYDLDSNDSMVMAESLAEVGERYKDRLTFTRLTEFEDILDIMKARSVANLDDLYVLDYIQLFRSSTKRYQSEREQLADYSTQLVDFVGKYKKPVLILSQLVKGETESFKGAQDILNMATVAGFITRSRDLDIDNELEKSEKFYRVRVNFKKVRRGPLFTVYGKVFPPDPAVREVLEGSFDLWDEM